MADSSETRNEQAKLSANSVNTVAIALLVVGGLTPLATILQEGDALPALLVLTNAVCIAASVALHLLGRRLLRSLVPS